MIVTNNGLRYAKDYEECTVSSSASFFIEGIDATRKYEWKIPFEKYSIAIDSVNCLLDYELYIGRNKIGEGKTELTLNSEYATEITVDTEDGKFPIELFLKNTEGDPNFIIEISSTNPSSYDVILEIVEANIGYKAEVYDLGVGNNQINIGKDLSVWGDASIGGDVSIGGSLTVPSGKGLKIGKLTGSTIDVDTLTWDGIININTLTKNGIIDVGWLSNSGSINIKEMAGGSLNCNVSKIGEAATSLERGNLYYFPPQKFDYIIIPGFIFYYSGEKWEAVDKFHEGRTDAGNVIRYYLYIGVEKVLVKKVYYDGRASYEDYDLKFYKLPITITITAKNPEG